MPHHEQLSICSKKAFIAAMCIAAMSVHSIATKSEIEAIKNLSFVVYALAISLCLASIYSGHGKRLRVAGRTGCSARRPIKFVARKTFTAIAAAIVARQKRCTTQCNRLCLQRFLRNGIVARSNSNWRGRARFWKRGHSHAILTDQSLFFCFERVPAKGRQEWVVGAGSVKTRNWLLEESRKCVFRTSRAVGVRYPVHMRHLQYRNLRLPAWPSLRAMAKSAAAAATDTSAAISTCQHQITGFARRHTVQLSRCS